MEIKISDVLQIANGELIQGNTNETLTEISIDTRTIHEGQTFVAIGTGNQYIEQAINSGAKICIVETQIDTELVKKYNNITIVKVENSIIALQKLAKYKREMYNIPVVAITGSVGKTSTKDIIANVVNQKYKVLKTEGNFNNHIGLPLTILKLKDHTALVVEMGMNHFGEIETLTKIAQPTIAVITNIGTSHIGILGSRENILKAKLEIVKGLKENGILIINNDNDLLQKWYKENNLKNTLTYGIENDSNYQAYNQIIQENNSEFKIKLKNKEYLVKVPISGTHFIYNSLAAISVGMALNIEPEEIINGIKTFELSKKRMELVKIDDITVINDAYNASYESMKYAIEYLKNIEGNRKIAVLGDMLELGDFAKELHEKVGEEVVKNNIDILVTVGENAKNIATKAIELNMQKNNIYQFNTNAEAIKCLKTILKPLDALLLKASNGMKFIQILEELKK